MVLFAIVAVLHCFVLSGLRPWLAGSPFDSLLFDGGSDGLRPGEGRLSRPVGVARKPASALLKALRKSAVRTSGGSAEETLGSWQEAVLPQLLSDRATALPSEPPPLEGHDAFGGDESPGWGEIVRVLGRDRASRKSWLVVEVRNGLGNRLRALASAMSVAAALQRPVMLVWVSGHTPCCAHAAHLRTATHMPSSCHATHSTCHAPCARQATCTATVRPAASPADPNPNPNQP